MITTTNLGLKIPEVADWMVNPATPGVDDTVAWLNFDFDKLDDAVLVTPSVVGLKLLQNSAGTITWQSVAGTGSPVMSSISISNGNGITGGGDLSASRTIALTALTADWDIGDGRMIQADKIRARDGDGLALYEDGGAGIFVKNGGNVGIGVTAPVYRTHVWESDSGLNAVIIQRGVQSNDANMVSSFGTPVLGIGRFEYKVGGGTYQTIGFGYKGASGYPAEIGLYTTMVGSGYTRGDIVFAVRQSSANVIVTEAMRITSGGLVGIGVIPAAKLAINGGVHIGGTTDPGDNNLLVDGNVEIDGAIDHDGTTVGFYGVAPVTRPTHTIDADGTLADITTKFNALLVKLENLGILNTA